MYIVFHCKFTFNWSRASYFRLNTCFRLFNLVILIIYNLQSIIQNIVNPFANNAFNSIIAFTQYPNMTNLNFLNFEPYLSLRLHEILIHLFFIQNSTNTPHFRVNFTKSILRALNTHKIACILLNTNNIHAKIKFKFLNQSKLQLTNYHISPLFYSNIYSSNITQCIQAPY